MRGLLLQCVHFGSWPLRYFYKTNKALALLKKIWLAGTASCNKSEISFVQTRCCSSTNT